MASIIVVGAGVAGTLAGRELEREGHEVTLVDKGHVPGGRVATRRVSAATFDTGAQFLTARSPRFAAEVQAWEAAGVVRPWFHGSPDLLRGGDPDGFPRFRGAPTMRALARHLAAGLDVRLGLVVDHLEVSRGRATVSVHHRDDAAQHTRIEADALLLTPPTPQTLALLDTGAVGIDPTTRAALEEVTYEPCIAVLAVPHGQPALPARGAVRLSDPVVGWITDNQATGASDRPALTIHATGAFSAERFGDPDVEVAADVLAAARSHLGVDAEPVHVHRWRYAAPRTRPDAPALCDSTAGVPIAFAGDGLAGGRVEGAAMSGWAAAALLADALDGQQRAAAG